MREAGPEEQSEQVDRHRQLRSNQAVFAAHSSAVARNFCPEIPTISLFSARRAAAAVESAPARATGSRLQSTNSNPYGRGRSTN